MPSKSTTSSPGLTVEGQAAEPAYDPPRGASPVLSDGLPVHRLQRIAEDRASSAESIVLETAGVLHAHVLSRSPRWSWDDAADELEEALTAIRTTHGWRGPVALFVDALRAAWHAGSARARAGDPSATARTLLRDELGLWLWGREEGCEELVSPTGAWNGRPFSPGLRMPLRTSVVERVRALTRDPSDSGGSGDPGDDGALRPLERGETFLIPAFSETVALALEAVQRAGFAPEAIVPEGAPHLEGRRLARRLAQAGVKVRYVYDALLATLLPRADRVWLGTEAIGVEGFAARIGTRNLLEEAARRDVPALILATTDKLVPGGALDLPAWGDRDTWLLWEHAPDGIRLEPQPYERVPHELTAGLLTEEGPATAASLSLSRLRLEPAPPCGSQQR